MENFHLSEYDSRERSVEETIFEHVTRRKFCYALFETWYVDHACVQYHKIGWQ